MHAYTYDNFSSKELAHLAQIHQVTFLIYVVHNSTSMMITVAMTTNAPTCVLYWLLGIRLMCSIIYAVNNAMII